MASDEGLIYEGIEVGFENWVAYKQPFVLKWYPMGALQLMLKSIGKVGIKEVARRSGLSPSTVSRIRSGKISPSFEVVERISEAVGFQVQLSPIHGFVKAPRLSYAKDLVGRLRNELRALGVIHATIYGSVARTEDNDQSDTDIYLDFGSHKPKVSRLLKAEGIVLEAFGDNKVDVVSDLTSPRGQRLKEQIEKDGIRVF